MRLSLPRLILPAVRLPKSQSRLRKSAYRRAKRAVLSFIAFFIILNVVLSVGMDTAVPFLRDGDYVSRRQRIEARAAANPGRPLAVVLGSSRSDHGIAPLALDDNGPLLANASQVGAGPLLQLLTLKRLLHDGVAPQRIVLEYWPPFLCGEGKNAEFIRIDLHRYFASDEQFVRDYHPDPEGTLRLMREIRRTPIWNHRQRLLSHILPSWLDYTKRLDHAWACVDAAGWMPGLDRSYPEHLKKAAEYYQPLLAHYTIDPLEARALREILTTCRSRGIAVTLLWLPESSEFRSWYPPEALALGQEFLAKLQAEFGVKAIVARDWMPDDMLADGYHLTQSGAIAFTKRLRPLLAP
jgi:hypothetical protein